MLIKECNTFTLKASLGSREFHSSQCAFLERNSLIVLIETEDGVVKQANTVYSSAPATYRS